MVHLDMKKRTYYTVTLLYTLFRLYIRISYWGVPGFATECPCGSGELQYIPRNMHTVFALLCFVLVIHWLIFPYPSGLLHWHCSDLTIVPVPAKQPWWIWINTSCEFIMNDCITTTKQSTIKPCAYFLGYTVSIRICYWGVRGFATDCPCGSGELSYTNGHLTDRSLITLVTSYRQISKDRGWISQFLIYTVKPVYNDHLMGYFSAFWCSSRWPRAT